MMPFERFKTKLLAEDNCKLMHDYDKNQDTEFWLKLPERLNNAFDTADKLESMLNTADEGDFDFDNIQFN